MGSYNNSPNVTPFIPPLNSPDGHFTPNGPPTAVIPPNTPGQQTLNVPAWATASGQHQHRSAQPQMPTHGRSYSQGTPYGRNGFLPPDMSPYGNAPQMPGTPWESNYPMPRVTATWVGFQDDPDSPGPPPPLMPAGGTPFHQSHRSLHNTPYGPSPRMLPSQSLGAPWGGGGGGGGGGGQVWPQSANESVWPPGGGGGQVWPGGGGGGGGGPRGFPPAAGYGTPYHGPPMNTPAWQGMQMGGGAPPWPAQGGMGMGMGMGMAGMPGGMGMSGMPGGMGGHGGGMGLPSRTPPPPVPIPPIGKGFDRMDPFTYGKHYGPVLDPTLVQILKCPVRINPLLAPPPEDGSDAPRLKWSMLFESNYCQRTDNGPRESWSQGRNDPATFPRVSSLRIISRTFPWTITIRARSKHGTGAVTCGDVIDQIADFMSKHASGSEYNEQSKERQKEISEAYKRNRETGYDVPGGRLGSGLLRLDWLARQNLFGGISASEGFVKDKCGALLPCMFELICYQYLPQTEQESRDLAAAAAAASTGIGGGVSAAGSVARSVAGSVARSVSAGIPGSVAGSVAGITMGVIPSTPSATSTTSSSRHSRSSRRSRRVSLTSDDDD